MAYESSLFYIFNISLVFICLHNIVLAKFENIAKYDTLCLSSSEYAHT
jgi:hypothetical protein